MSALSYSSTCSSGRHIVACQHVIHVLYTRASLPVFLLRFSIGVHALKLRQQHGQCQNAYICVLLWGWFTKQSCMILGYGGRSRRADGRKHADIGWSGDIEYRQGRRYRSTFGHLRARDAEIALQFWEKLGIIVYNEERSSVRFAKAEYVELCGMNKTKLRAHARDKGLSSEGSKKTILDRVVRHSRGEIVQGRAHASPRDRSFIKSSLNEAQKLVKTVSEKKRADGKHKSRF